MHVAKIPPRNIRDPEKRNALKPDRIIEMTRSIERKEQACGGDMEKPANRDATHHDESGSISEETACRKFMSPAAGCACDDVATSLRKLAARKAPPLEAIFALYFAALAYPFTCPVMAKAMLRGV